MNISIPDHLKARMDALGEPVNWSRVAAEAFGRRLDAAGDDFIRTFKGGVATEALLVEMRKERDRFKQVLQIS